MRAPHRCWLPLVGLTMIVGCSGAPASTSGSASADSTAAVAAQFGNNAVAGRTFTHDGVTLYYETYGSGEPLLLVHGNGASIGSLRRQIEHFRKEYQVIAMDSRDHGKSSDSQGPLTYEKMTDDLAALIDHLQLGRVHVLGWSDGGIEALLMGIRHPDKINKLVAMAANLNPSPAAIPTETLALFDQLAASMTDSAKATPEGKRSLKVMGIMKVQPNIAPTQLRLISAPTLVIAGDHDLIRNEHTVEIFSHLPNAQLAIVPNATHMLPYDDPATFNWITGTFLKTPFKKKDRIADLMVSYEQLLAELGGH
jgi:pimeloyl-ACP methyl ester carboxylesterase